MRIAATLGLFLAEVIVLALQPVPRSAPGLGHVVEEKVSGMSVQIHQERLTTTFTLRGLPPGVEPRLTVSDGQKDLSNWLLLPERGPGEVSQRLSYMGVEMYPARRLTYTWQVGGESLSGEYLYVHPNYPFSWEVEQRGPLVFYHSGNLSQQVAADWGEAYQWLGAELGMEPVERVVYLLPDRNSLQKALGSDPLVSNVAGLWVGRLQGILTSTDFSPEALRLIMTHEFAHAYLENDNPSWWEEGIATWIEARYLSRFVLPSLTPEGLRPYEALAERMRAEPVLLVRINQSQASPLDPYTVGYSFCRYVESQWGDGAVLRLAVAAAARPLKEAVFEVLGQSLDAVEAGWQEYVRSGDLVEDLASD